MKKKKLTEGRKMFVSVMIIFAVYALIFILFEDYDRYRSLSPFNETSDWHLLVFTIVVMGGLSVLLHHYSKHMDERIMRERSEKETEMRRELTQNISHELKTPVSSIVGFTETLLETPGLTEDQRRMFIERTNAQAIRLKNLLNDLSTLNRIDYARQMITMEMTDVSQIVAEISSELSLTLQQKNIRLNNCLPSSVFVTGNRDLIYSLFRILFENAINYAGQASTIEITATFMADGWEFTFSDDGNGVSDEHLPRLFERFYRIDKGRSRANGGTGLGLAIVKNAVLLHGGTITAMRNNDHGLKFVFTLQK